MIARFDNLPGLEDFDVWLVSPMLHADTGAPYPPEEALLQLYQQYHASVQHQLIKASEDPALYTRCFLSIRQHLIERAVLCGIGPDDACWLVSVAYVGPDQRVHLEPRFMRVYRVVRQEASVPPAPQEVAAPQDPEGIAFEDWSDRPEVQERAIQQATEEAWRRYH